MGQGANDYRVSMHPGGGVSSCSLRNVRDVQPDEPMGLHVRGVVMETYMIGDPRPDAAMNRMPGGQSSKAVYCDVLIYSGLRGARTGMLYRCLCLGAFGGMHEGTTWSPRSSKIDLSSGEAPDFDGGTNPADCDGDHVVCSFLDADFFQPIIVGFLPHPRGDQGNEQRPLGARLGQQEKHDRTCTSSPGPSWVSRTMATSSATQSLLIRTSNRPMARSQSSEVRRPRRPHSSGQPWDQRDRGQPDVPDAGRIHFHYRDPPKRRERGREDHAPNLSRSDLYHRFRPPDGRDDHRG